MSSDGSSLLPSIKPILGAGRTLSPLRINPLPSPHFATVSANQPASYFSPISPAIPQTPSGILLKPKLPETALGIPIDSADGTTASLGATPARVASPDGTASDASAPSEGYRSAGAGAEGSTAPSSTGSPAPKSRPMSPADSLATLTLASEPGTPVLESGSGTPGGRSRSASVHCHFAPLPKVDGERLPGTRRNSSALAAVARSQPTFGTEDVSGEPFVIDLEHSLNAVPSTWPSTSPPPHSSGVHLPRSHRSSRSSSPSPSRPPSVPSSHPGSRTHSPVLSRHASNDALSLHFIEGSHIRSASASRNSSRDRNGSRSRDERGRERDFDFTRSQWREEAGTDSASHETLDGAAVVAPSALRKMVFAEPAIGDHRSRPTSMVRRRSRSTEAGVTEDVVDLERELNTDPDEEDEDAIAEDEDEDEEEGDGNGEGESGDPDGDDDDEDAEEDEIRATARAGGTEVVRWHRDSDGGDKEE